MISSLPGLLSQPSCGMKRMLVGVLSAATVAGVAIADPKPATQNLKPDSISVTASPIGGFDRADRAKTAFGKLEWRGGLVLTSPIAAFGGWSGLVVDADGQTFLAVSDAGTWMTGTLDYSKGQLSGLSATKLGPLTAIGGKSLDRGRYRDAEAVALASGTLANGALLISFEQKNRIGRFRIGKDGLTPPSEYLKMPPEMIKRRGTDGIEAVTVLRGGPLAGATLAMAEAVKTKVGHRAGWIWQGKEPKPFAVTDIGDFNVTDVAGLPNGDLLVLERRFRWSEGVKIRLRQVAAAEVKPGAVVSGDVLMAADLGQEIDNMEGLGVHTNAAGETIVTMISDDNFNRFLQRTVLLQFAITGDKRERTAQP
jgi:hypothetical protein